MSIEKVYWDSDCFLGFLQDEQDKVPECEQVLQAAQDGTIQIVTSTLTLAEVLRMKGRQPVPKDKRDEVVNFFKNPYILVRNITRKTGELARDMVWDNGIDPKDSLHVAAALEAGMTRFHTFDVNLLKKTDTIGNPPLIIERPSVAQPKLRLVQK